MGSTSLHGNGQFWGFAGPLKSIASLWMPCIHGKWDHSILNNGTIRDAAFCQNCFTICLFVVFVVVFTHSDGSRYLKKASS